MPMTSLMFSILAEVSGSASKQTSNNPSGAFGVLTGFTVTIYIIRLLKDYLFPLRASVEQWCNLAHSGRLILAVSPEY